MIGIGFLGAPYYNYSMKKAQNPVLISKARIVGVLGVADGRWGIIACYSPNDTVDDIDPALPIIRIIP